VTWRLTFRPSAQRELEGLDPPTRGRIQRALLRLAADPRQSPGVKAMTDGNYRLRVGDWRVVYTLRDDVLVVLVLALGIGEKFTVDPSPRCRGPFPQPSPLPRYAKTYNCHVVIKYLRQIEALRE
jgi:mRNA interferase RelE/StbE